MALVTCVPGPSPFLLEPRDGNSITITTLGKYLVSSSVLIPSLEGREQVEWADTLIEANRYADERGIQRVYHVSR
jgi:hypothetical protein